MVSRVLNGKSKAKASSVRTVKVLAFGTFDLVHPGHLSYLEQAKRQGGRNAELVVIVARDSSVRKIKGHSSFFDEKERLRLIGALKAVDRARLGVQGKHRYEVLVEEKPDVIVLGYDQGDMAGKIRAFLNENGLNAKIVRVKPFKERKLKSSKIRAHYRL